MTRDTISKVKFYALLLMFLPVVAFGQRKQPKAKAIRQTIISSRVTDENGAPLRNAMVSTQEGTVTTYSGEDGSFVLKALPGSVVMIQANGYEDKVIEVAEGGVLDSYALEKMPLFSSSRDVLYLPLGITTSKRSTVSSISSIDGADLETYPDLLLTNTLQGRATGLTVRHNTGELGNNAPALIIRGLSRGGSDGAITIVDGVERPMEELVPAEIDRVEILKDATAKVLYGSRAANGVILVTTKRGKANTRVTKVSAEYGTMMATRMPKFLGAYDYATLYNEARENDGLAPFYSETELNGYRNSAGANDQRYPNADFYGYFLKDAMPYRRASLQFLGGDNRTQYALVVGYTGASGLEKINTPTNDRFNLRGNLDLEVTPSLRAFAGLAGIIGMTTSADITSGAVFSRLSSHKPNGYPFIIDNEELRNLNAGVGVTSIPALGGSLQHPDNLYGRLMYGGSQHGQNLAGQGTFGLDLKLGNIIPGLAAKSYLTFDNYQSFSRGQSETPVSYGQRWFLNDAGEEQVTYYKLQKRVIQSDQVRKGHSISRTLGWVGEVKYHNQVGVHELTGDVTYFYYRNESSGQLQDVENSNLALRLAYGLQNKYYLEGTAAYMGSNRLASKNRHFLSWAAGAAWVLSEEAFLQGSSAVNFLKLKANIGILGYDRATDYYLFQNRWYTNGTMPFNERNQTSFPRTSIELIGNPDLDWEKSREFSVGVEGLAFQNRLQFEFNFFDELRYDIIMRQGAQYTGIHGGLVPFTNYGETSNRGLEGSISWQQSVGEVHVKMGGNFIYSKNKVLKTDEVAYPEEYMRQTGRGSDALFGYVANGLFRDQAQVESHAFQTFGAYGIGDIKYADLNSDGLVDSRDRKQIGNSFPRTTLGMEVTLQYKGFGLYLLGTSELGVDKMLNNSYYWNFGEGKYSTTAFDRWHPQNNPGGTAPRLTTTNGANNHIGSSFWLDDASFWRLKNVELSYTLNTATSFAKGYRFFVRGTNLLVLSSIRDLDPEVLNGGVANYPVMRGLTGGVSLSF
ncbi:SusC/RagA family TonB-linked outer membrane protein [Rufibacter ruber]|uniref:SusC/RagA family TonB-linked outer membrane protein n=1 Tax=Rufibacter ruber TaxID=1783499 RepID=UPI00082C2C0D|nr:SusC/RagA family TonB-linked outer membrane protein [Rufibacter ruber]